MTEPQDAEADDGLAVGRRDVLKTVGGTGAIGAAGTATARQPERTGRQPDRRIVGVEPGRADEARGRADEVIKTLDFGRIGQAVVGRWPEPALRGLRRNPHVRYVEADVVVRPGGHDGGGLDWGDDRIDADVAHEAGHLGAGTSVAILDTGIDTRHDQLVDNLHDTLHLAPSVCDGGDCPEDWHDDGGHGTLVAGIVAAAHDAGTAPFGVAPEATLHAVKVLGGSSENGFGSDLAEGLEWVADEGIDVANMSLWSSESQTIEDALEYAADNGVVLVTIAGNNRGGVVTFPGTDPRTIAVSGITELDELSTISSTGPGVDVGAPTAPAAGSGQDGRGIRTTALDGGTDRSGGTSSATPHVAGAAALVLANGTAPEDVRDLLADTAQDVGLPAEEQGAGLVDVANALGLDSANDLLDVETRSPGARRHERASMIGQLNHLVGSDSARVFFEVREQGESDWERTAGEDVDPDGPIAPVLGNGAFFEGTAENLEPDTRYEFRAAATVTDDGEGWESTDRGAVETLATLGYPVADFEVATDPPLNEGDTVVFDASNSEAPTDRHAGLPREIDEYEWDFGDGTTATTDEPVVEHSYGPAGEGNWGTYDVTLAVTDEDGGSDDEVSVHGQAVRVNAYPVAGAVDVLVGGEPIDPLENPAVQGEPVTFDASDSRDPDGDVVEYEWDFGDGTVETTGDPTTEHAFDEGGRLTVTLAVTDDDGASHDEISVHEETITVAIRATVEVKPGGDGAINPRRPGTVPVAVHHAADFDSAAELDPSTVRFGNPAAVNGGGGAAPAHDGGHVEDVDDDGDADWIGHFPVRETEFERGDDEGKLVGERVADGVPVFGFDDVRTVGGR